jgi:hypothetical protein
MIAAEFQLTRDDYAEAQVSHIRKILGYKLGLAALVLGAALAITVAIAWMDPANIRQLVPSWIFFAAMFLFAFLLRSGLLYRMQFDRMKSLHDPIHFEAGDAGVVYRTTTGESTRKWEGFEKWGESAGSFRLYVQPRLFLLVPKRGLGEGQKAALRQLLQGRIH